MSRPTALVLLACVLGGAIVAAVSGLTSSWDAPIYMWSTLDRQTPFVANRRPIDYLLELPLLAASQLTSNHQVLEVVFGLTLAAVPLVVLLACIQVVGWRSRLLVWPALATGFATIVTQSVFISETLIATQLFWPALLAVLVGRPVRRSILAVVLVALSVGSHPFAIGTLGASMLVALARRSWQWAAVLGAGTLAAIARSIWFSVPYESQQATFRTFEVAFGDFLEGWNALGWALAVAGAVVLFFAMRRTNRTWAYVSLALFTAAAGLFALWATDPESVLNALYVRTFVPVLVVAFAGLAVLDSWRPVPSDSPNGTFGTKSAVVLSGIAFAAVLTIQSVHWWSFRDGLRAGVAAAPPGCVSLEPLPHMPGMGATPFWTETAYSVVLQGRVIDRIAEPMAVCASGELADHVRISEYQTIPYGSGWYDFSPLR